MTSLALPAPSHTAASATSSLSTRWTAAKLWFSSLIEKINLFAIQAFKVGVCVILFLTNHNLFALGFVAGILFDTQAKKAAEKLKHVWEQASLPTKSVLFLGAFFDLPITLGISATVVSAYLGSSLYQEKFIAR